MTTSLDPSARMNAARDLAESGLHSEALAEYLWCFDRGHVEDPAFGGVRVSFLLMYMRRLADGYPPALEALRQRRDAAESRLLHEADDRVSAWEFAQITQDLSEPERLLALFQRLFARTDRPVALAELLGFVLPLLVDARRYAAVLATANPQEVVGALARQLGSNIEELQNSSDPLDNLAEHLGGTIEYLKKSFVDEAADYFEVLLGAGRETEALACADRVLEVSPTGNSYATLIDHAVHAGTIGVAHTLARRGLETLPDAERGTVAEAVERIPGS